MSSAKESLYKAIDLLSDEETRQTLAFIQRLQRKKDPSQTLSRLASDPAFQDPNHLRLTLQQMRRLLRALDDLKDTVLPKDPQLFAVMAEAPLEDLDRLRQEVEDFLDQLQPVS
jgi:hypothetical protein